MKIRQINGYRSHIAQIFRAIVLSRLDLQQHEPFRVFRPSKRCDAMLEPVKWIETVNCCVQRDIKGKKHDDDDDVDVEPSVKNQIKIDKRFCIINNVVRRRRHARKQLNVFSSLNKNSSFSNVMLCQLFFRVKKHK